MKVSTVLATKKSQIISIAPQQTVADAVELYRQHNIGALVVLNEKKQVVGILSERDIIRRLGDLPDILHTQVAELMTKDVIVGVPQDSLMSVMNTMTENRFRHLPIMENDELIGIISIGDVIKTQRDQYRGEIDTLEAQLMANQR